jgi:Family of unknown function (DUF6221)
MDDLVAFLYARLDEDETAAKAATDGPWKTEVFGRGSGRQEWVVVGHTGSRATINGEVGVGWMAGLPHDGEHIARHDPVRVLREVAAKRAILELHHPDQKLENWYWSARVCAECKHSWHRIVPGRPPTEIGPEAGCPTLRQLAAVYADHPGYRQEWKP